MSEYPLNYEAKTVYTKEMCDRGFQPSLRQDFKVNGDEDCDDGFCYLTCVAHHVDGGVIAENIDKKLYVIKSGFMPVGDNNAS